MKYNIVNKTNKLIIAHNVFGKYIGGGSSVIKYRRKPVYNNQIKKIRENKGMSMTQLSNLSDLSVGYICHLENGTRNNPSIETMEKIAQALNKSVWEVFFK